jgi:hypothetical protein
LRGTNRGDVAARARADHDDIKLVSHPNDYLSIRASGHR